MKKRSDVWSKPGAAAWEMWETILLFGLCSVQDQTFPSLDGFRAQLAEAELSKKLSEFHVYGLQAMLCLGAEPEAAPDYLEMADDIASTYYQKRTLRLWRMLEARHASYRQDLETASDSLWENLRVHALRVCVADVLRYLSNEEKATHPLRPWPAMPGTRFVYTLALSGPSATGCRSPRPVRAGRVRAA